MTLTLARPAYDTVVAHACDEAPAEACGVLGGTRGADECSVDLALRASNAADDPHSRYELDPAEQGALLERVEGTGRDVVGFYHSHPEGPPRPSEADVAGATWAGYTYAVVDLSGSHPFLGAWRWTGADFRQEAVALADDAAER
ncbi:MAG: desampylase [Halorientalis sp.]